MELAELDQHELRVFMGLFKLMVHADREVTSQERSVIADLSSELGIPRWNEAVAEASAAYGTVEELEADARQVVRRPAQELMYDLLSTLAHADELVEAEAHMLRWVAQEWRVEASEGDEPGEIDSFVLIEDDDG